MPLPDYFETNRQSWNAATDIHIASAFYDNESFLKGKNTLNEIELELLGNVSGKSILHLQCHFGQDTISLSRMGAQATGVDLSDIAIERARLFAAQTGSNAQFICCNVYDLLQHLDRQFDIVFTSYGAICWLPDIWEWAALVSQYLKPNGKLIMVEFHPFIYAFDNNFIKIEYSYFNTLPIIEESAGTYANQEAEIQQQSITWNHPISDILNSLMHNELQIATFNEYNYSPYNCFKGMVAIEKGKFQIEKFGDKFPMVYALVASKK